jgi:hypothetical protein
MFGVSAIFQLYHGDQFYWWKKPEYTERTTDHGEATGKLYPLRLRVECTLFTQLHMIENFVIVGEELPHILYSVKILLKRENHTLLNKYAESDLIYSNLTNIPKF